MAVATRDEQFSVILIDMPFGRVFFNPTGSLGTAEQMQMIGKFSSDISGGVAESIVGEKWAGSVRRRHRLRRR